MQIQEIGAAWLQARRPGLFCFSLVFLLGLSACATDSTRTSGDDYSLLPAGKLLQVFLENERSKGSVKLSFKLDILTEDENPERLRGVAAFAHCADVRIKLVGTVGLTVLDYLSVAGKSNLLVDKLTPPDDDEARQGLLDTMEIFTSSLTGLCRPSSDFKILSIDADSVRYKVRSSPGHSLEITLDRKRAVLEQQSLGGESLPLSTISYGKFERIENRWMPHTIVIKTAGSPVDLELGISRWQTNAQLPADIFVAGFTPPERPEDL